MAVIDEIFNTSDPRARVRAEQRDINARNAGQIDANGNEFVPLVVDGLVGPLTRAARNFTPVDATVPGVVPELVPQVVPKVTPKVVPKVIPKSTVKPESSANAEYVNYLRDQNIAGAKSIIESFLKKFGLAGLTSWAQRQADLGMSSDAITMELRYGADPTVRKIYDEAFPAMAIRRDNGYMDITESESMELDRGYKQIASAAGLDPKLVGKAQVTTLLSNDVSLSEFRDRVQTAEDYVNDLPAEAKAIAQQTYGYTNQDMVSYILDPTLTKDIKKTARNFDVSRLRGASSVSLNQTFSEEIGELLVSNDVQAREISARLSPLAGLTDSTIYDDALTADTLAEASFGLDSNSGNSLRRTRAQRLSNFSGNSGQLTTQEGIVGLGRAT